MAQNLVATRMKEKAAAREGEVSGYWDVPGS